MYLLFAAALLVAGAVGVWINGQRRQRVWRVIAGIGTFILGSGAALFVLAFLLRGLMCGQYDFPAVASPDGDRVASVSEVDCGAIDSFHSTVRLRRRAASYLAWHMRLPSSRSVTTRGSLGWNGLDLAHLLSAIPMTPSIRGNLGASRTGKTFRSSAYHLPLITASRSGKCRPFEDGCGEMAASFSVSDLPSLRSLVPLHSR